MEKFVRWSPLQFAHVGAIFCAVRSGAIDAYCFFITVSGSVAIRLTPETCWFWSFVFFPVYFYVLDASGTFNLFFGAFFRDVPSTNVSR